MSKEKEEHYLKKELNQLLQENTDIFDFIEEASLDGLWYWNLERPEDEWMSPNFWTTFGYDPKEKRHIASEWQDMIFQEDLQVALENFRLHCEDPSHPYDQVVRYRHKNGKVVWIRCRGMALRDEKGKPIRMVGAHNDISQFKETELALRESEEKFRLLFDDAPFGYHSLDQNGFFVEVNKKWLSILGYDKGEILGKAMQKILTKDSQKQWKKDFELVNHKDYLIHEYKMFDALGHIRTVSMTLKKIYNRKKSEYYIHCTLMDITKLKTIELEGKKAEEQYKLLSSKMQLGLALHEIICDEEGRPIDFRFLSVNDSWVDLMGIQREDIVGKTVMEVFPDTEPYWIEVFGRVALTGEPYKYENYSKELKSYISTSLYSPAKNQFAAVVENITERKLIEQKNRAYRDLLEKLPNQVPGVLYKYQMFPDGHSCFPYASEGIWDIYEIHPKDVTNDASVVFSRIHSEDINGVTESIKKSFDSLDIWDEEYRVVLPTLGERWVHGTSKPEKQEDGSVLWYGYIMDITEKKAKEKEVEHANYHDYLTKLPNRRYFHEQLNYLDQKKYYPLAIVFIDMNGLKLINDAFGFNVGNDALITCANTLNRLKGSKDFLARIGGDEFALVLTNTSDEEVNSLRQQIIDAIRKEMIADIHLSVSVGYELKEKSAQLIREVLMSAENNMYKNKVITKHSTHNDSIQAILNTLQNKYEEEKVHSKRVSDYCRKIGVKLGLRNNQIEELALAGMVHDIGKISIPDAILKKPGKLSKKEWSVIKNHTINGYQILRAADRYSNLAEYAMSHHERIDGNGYPNGLKGTDIPLFSRIICVADAYEAMTSDRVYRKALSKEEAVLELQKHAGTQFDAEIVDIFIEIINANKNIKERKEF